MIAMLVLGRIEAHDLPGCAARGHDGDLALEIDERFKNRRLRTDRPEGRRGFARVADQGLTLAVVPEASRLEHRRLAEICKRGGQLLWRGGRRERCCRNGERS